MGTRPIIGALGAPILAATMLGLTPAATIAASDTPYHPTVLWATSEETVGEGAPNGTIAALVDDDTARTDATKTFWTTKWKGGLDPYPHALAVQNPTPGTQVCGLGLTPRPTYDSTLGNDQFPGEYRVFAFDEDPGNPAAEASFDDWKMKVVAGTWDGGTELAHGSDLQYGNKEQYVTFPATTKRVIALAGLRSLAPGKSDMALSDIKLLPCDADGNAITSYGGDEGGGNNDAVRPVVPHPEAPEQGSGASDLVVDFVIDQLPYGEPGKPVDFAPSTHTYTATGYYHATTVSARLRAVEGAAVTINGVTPDAAGRVSNLDLATGLNVITATVSKDGKEATYVVNITKVETDFRGNVLVPATASANGGTEADNAALTDLDPTTTWTSDPLVRASDWSSNVTGIELHLGEARYVHRVNGWGTPTLPAGAQGWHGGNSVAIAVQEADGGPWTTIVTHGSLTRDARGLWYWDFNAYHLATNIRIWMNDETEPQTPQNIATAVTFNDVEVWGLPAGKTPVAPAVDNSMYERYSGFNPGDGRWGVNRAQALALQYGVMMPAWVPSEGYGRGGFDANERDLTGGAFPMFYDLPMFNTPMMESLGKGAPWALAKAPTGKNSMCNAGDPHDFMNDYMKPYASTLVDIQYGDEGGFNRGESECFKNWFAWSKQNIPGAVVHANSWDDPSWYRDANLSYYVENAQPDLLSWDKYYWGANGGPAPSTVVMDLLNTNTWKKQREYGLKGLTGDGSSPILYGQYLDYNWDANVSASEKSIVPSLGLATGQKWFGLFRMEYNGYDRSSIIDHDGAPTRSFYEFSTIFGNVSYIGNYTKAMNSTFVAYKPGQYAARSDTPTLSGYTYGNFATGDEATAANEAVGLVDMSVTNVGSVNDGLPGDVVVGYFEQLGGLDGAKSAEIFGDSTTAPTGFMVVNALTGQTRYPSYLLDPRTDNGSLAETAQDITLTVKKPNANAHLMLVNPADKTRQEVELGDGETSQVVLTAVGGGDSRFLYWVTLDNPTPDPTPDPSPEPNPSADPTPAPTPDPTVDPIPDPTVDPTPDPAPQPRAGQWKSGYFGWWYAYSDGTYAANETLVIDGLTYRFDASGYLKMGWVHEAGHWYYHGTSGAQQVGWVKDRGSWYYFDPATGAMATGWTQISGSWFYMSSSGAMRTGWVKDDGTWYYLSPSGSMTTGWTQIGGSWYHFGTNGAMTTGWYQEGPTWFYLRGSGSMATGWELIGWTWYHFAPSGAWIG